MQTTSGLRHRLLRLSAWLGLFPLVLPTLPSSATSGAWKLSRTAPFSVSDFELSPDGRWAVYVEDVLSVTGAVVSSVSLDGRLPTLLSSAVATGPLADVLAISPDSSRLVFLDVDRRIWSVPIGGPSSAAVELMPPGALAADFLIAPDSSRVVFRGQVGATVDLFSVPIDGSEPEVPLHGNTASSFGYPGLFAYRFTPDASQIVYDQSLPSSLGDFMVTPWIVSADRSSPPSALHETIIATDLTLQLTPDGSRVLLYPGDASPLLSIPLADPGGVDAISLPADTSQAREIAISPDSRWFAFLADDALGPGVDLSFARLDRSGTAHTTFRSALASTPGVRSFEVDPTSRRVILTAARDPSEPVEVWSMPLDPRASPTRLNGPIVPAAGEVLDFQISPDGEWVVYRADQIYEDWPMGFRVPVDGPSGSADLIWGLAPLESADWDITPDGGSVVLASVAPFVDGIYRPWSVPLVGTPRPAGRELVDAAAFQPEGDVVELRVGAGGRIVYLADQDVEGVFELYLVTFLFADGFESGDPSAWSASVP